MKDIDASNPRLIAMLAGVVVLAGLIAYSTGTSGVFIFDDVPGILQNPLIRDAWPPWETGRSPHRIVVAFTFAVNHAIHGLEPRGFHLFNIAIHLVAGLVLFGVVRRTLLTPRMAQGYTESAPWLAAVIAAAWTAHPLTTQAVTYVSQRYESMMGMFYLLTLYGFIRGTTGRRKSWYLVALLCSALGMCSKRVMITAPVIILLYDLVFLADSPREIMRRRWKIHLGLIATIAVPFVLAPIVPPEPGGVARAMGPLGVSPLAYALTQAEVIPHYARLVLWPVGQCFDYAWAPVTSLGDVAGAAVLITALGLATLLAFGFAPALGFLGAWFFGILAPTSSFVPIDDLAVEHRMYLPAAAVIALVVMGCHAAIRKIPVSVAGRSRRTWAAGVLATVVIAALVARTAQRNRVYRSALTVWRDVVSVRPSNTRAHAGLGSSYLRINQLDKAIAALETGVRMLPDLSGIVYHAEQAGQYGYHTRHAITLSVQMQSNLGIAHLRRHEFDLAIRYFQSALRVFPGNTSARNNLGIAFMRAGRPREAVAEWLKTLKFAPADIVAHTRLGEMAMRAGEYARARDHFETAIRTHGALEAARQLALLLAACPSDNLRDGRRAVTLARDAVEATRGADPLALEALAAAYAEIGDFSAAVDTATRALQFARGAADLAPVIEARLSGYQNGKPCRLEATDE